MPLSLWRAAEEPGHQGIDAAFIEENQTAKIQTRQAVLPDLTLGFHVGPLLFAGMSRLFWDNFISLNVRWTVLMLTSQSRDSNLRNAPGSGQAAPLA